LLYYVIVHSSRLTSFLFTGGRSTSANRFGQSPNSIADIVGQDPRSQDGRNERLRYSLSLIQEFGWTDLCLAGRNPPEAF